GTLIAVYDARYTSSRDLQGHMDIAINRSFDGGVNWEPMQVVLDMKQWGGLPEKYNGVSDACILVDENSDNIYVAGLWMHGVLDEKSGEWIEGLTDDSTRWIHQWRAKGSQPGVGIKQTSQFLITKSNDDGSSWSEPINITSQTKRPEWWLYAPAPGHGITLRDGTLVFPTQGRDENGVPFSNITWSRDGGDNWVTSNPAYSNTTECMAVELLNGSIMLNMRDNRNRGNVENNGRRICVTSDLGQTWSEHPTSRNALIEPTCMASIHRHNYMSEGKQRSVLLFCNPESYNRRDHMTLKISFDDGQTWPNEHKIELDEYSSFGYSCITSVDEHTIGILYEGSQAQMVFQQINLEDLIGQ
ncbi:MAG: sialidase family protein, partial [Bacteroidales bacterium]